MQSFKNYIHLNIPITDIFKKKVSFDGNRVQTGPPPQDDRVVGSLFYVDKDELVYPAESIDPNDPEWIYEDEKNKSIQE